MKQDRFLLGILIGIGVLVVVALTLFFVRPDNQSYVDDSTPNGVVHNYSLALYQEDYEKAYGYLGEAEFKPTFSEFQKSFFNHYVDPRNAGLEIGESKISGEDAFVTLYLIYNPSDPFSSGYRNTETAQLERQNGKWKIMQMPYNFWSYDWYLEPPKPVY